MAARAPGDGHGGANIGRLGGVGGFEADDQQRRAVLDASGLPRLHRVEQAQVGGPQLGLDDLPHRFGALRPTGEGDARGGAERRAFLQAQPALADDAEDAFGADHHAVRARTSAAARQAPGFPPAPGRQQAGALHEVVDVGLVGGVVASGAGRHPTADRGPREALRKVAQGEAFRAQGILKVRAEDSGLHPGGAGHRVDFQYPVEAVEVDRHDGVGPLWRIHAPNHGRAAAVGHHHMALLVRPGQGSFEFPFGGRMGYCVGRILKAATQRRQQLQRMAAVGVQQPLLRIRAHPALQGRGHLEARRSNVDVGQVRHRRRRHFDTRAPGDALRCLLPVGQTRFIGGEAPSPEAAFS